MGDMLHVFVACMMALAVRDIIRGLVRKHG